MIKFRNIKGKLVAMDEENAQIVENNFSKMLNRDVEVDWNRDSKRKEKGCLLTIANELSREEFDEAASKASWHESPEVNGMSPSTLKILNAESSKGLRRFIKE